MKTQNHRVLTALGLLLFGATFFCRVERSQAQTFENKGDVTFSAFTTLGSVEITVSPAFRPLIQASTPAGFTYDPTTGILRSPQLYDPSATMGISNALLDGSAADVNGVQVGTANAMVAENNLTPPPGWGFGANTREQHTQIISINMTGGNTAFRVGSAAPARPASVGEIESQSGPNGAPANDFPASSFFDVFAELDLPALDGGSGVTTLYNSAPLIFNSSDSYVTTSTPAFVSYGFMNLTNPNNPTPPNTPSVPLYFKSNSSSNLWLAGDQFGTYRLYNYIGQPQQLPEPGAVSLVAAAVAMLLGRRRAATCIMKSTRA